MPMAGLMKSHSGYINNSSRGRPYGMLLLLAFVAAIVGVMVLHRFRERRIFNLLIKEKDSDLISLHLLLQKERDYVKEAKWKLEDMRAKIHTLRAQKKELDGRITEMHSTVSSLREEQRTIESALEEKENEIKMLRDKNTHIDDENKRVKAVSEAYRHKESENENLKHQQETPVHVWSVSTDDPSNSSVNSQMKTRTESDAISVNKGKASSREMRVSTNQEAEENLTEQADSSRGESGNSKEVAKQGDFRRENAESRNITLEQLQEQDHSIESNTEERIIKGEGKKSGKYDNRGEEMGTTKNAIVGSHRAEAQRPRDETNEGHTSGDKVTEMKDDSALGSYAQGAENQEHGSDLNGGIKSQILVNSNIGAHVRKATNLKRAKGKRWTIMRSKAGHSKNNGVAVIRGKTSVERTSAETRENSEPQNKRSGLRHETDPVLNISDSLAKGEASEHEDSIDVVQDARNTASYPQMKAKERTNATNIKTEMAHIALKDEPTNMIPQIDDSKASPGEQRIRELGKSAKEAAGIQQQEEEIDRKKEEVSEQSKKTDFDEEPNNPEDFQEQESETETSIESTSNSEAYGEGRKGKTDELEF